MVEFTLWLEFEEVDPASWDKDNDFANVHVELADGRHYGINVWTFKFFETTILLDVEGNNNLKGLYLMPPDLFVKEMTRSCIQATIEDLLKKGDLENLLNPSIKI